MVIYQAPVIKSLLSFYGDDLYPRLEDSIFSHLNKLAIKMYDGIIQSEKSVFIQISNYHPNYLGVPVDKLKEIKIDLAACMYTIANEYSFTSWTEVKNLTETKYNLVFEECVNSIITGKFEKLKSLILSIPQIIYSRSQYGHCATLLHYTTSNGVELWRQQVPQNLTEITKFLIDNGADKKATMNVYGSQYSTLQLLQTSVRPYDAGIAHAMIDILK